MPDVKVTRAGYLAYYYNRRRRHARIEGVGVLPQSLALFERMTATGVSPSEARKTNINNLIRSLVGATVWDELDYLQVRSAETEAHALLNWVGDYSNATKVGSPVFTENEGFVCSAGSGNYINVGFNPGDGLRTYKYLRDDAFFSIGSRTDANQNAFDIGQRTSNIAHNANILIRNDAAGGLLARINEDTTVVSVANATAIGRYVVRRSGAGATAVFKNGTQIATGTGASSAIQNRVWYEGTLNNAGVATTAPTKQYSYSAAGGSLTDAQIAAFDATLNTFFTAILAEVI
jgi:hypothetical protein